MGTHGTPVPSSFFPWMSPFFALIRPSFSSYCTFFFFPPPSSQTCLLLTHSKDRPNSLVPPLVPPIIIPFFPKLCPIPPSNAIFDHTLTVSSISLFCAYPSPLLYFHENFPHNVCALFPSFEQLYLVFYYSPTGSSTSPPSPRGFISTPSPSIDLS